MTFFYVEKAFIIKRISHKQKMKNWYTSLYKVNIFFCIGKPKRLTTKKHLENLLYIQSIKQFPNNKTLMINFKKLLRKD